MGLHSYSQPSSSSSLQVWSSGGQPEEVNFKPPPSGIPDKCFCGGETVLKCSKSDESRGRIFLGCTNHKDGDVGESGDHIMKWWDEAITQELQEIKAQAAYLARQDTEDTLWFQQELLKVKAQMEEVRLSELRRIELVKNMFIAGIILVVVLVSLVI